MISSDSIINSLSFAINEVNSIDKLKSNIQLNIEDIESELEQLNKKVALNKDSKKFYSQAINIIYDQSVGALKCTLNTALGYTFYDRNLEANLTLEDKRGNKTLDLSTNDLDKGLEALDPLEDDGQGPAIVIGNIAKLYFLLNSNSKLLFLDEKLAGISAAYAPRYFEFLKSLTSEKGFIIGLVSHDNRHTEYGDYIFEVASGMVTECSRKF